MGVGWVVAGVGGEDIFSFEGLEICKLSTLNHALPGRGHLWRHIICARYGETFGV